MNERIELEEAFSDKRSGERKRKQKERGI